MNTSDAIYSTMVICADRRKEILLNFFSNTPNILEVKFV